MAMNKQYGRVRSNYVYISRPLTVKQYQFYLDFARLEYHKAAADLLIRVKWSTAMI